MINITAVPSKSINVTALEDNDFLCHPSIAKIKGKSFIRHSKQKTQELQNKLNQENSPPITIIPHYKIHIS